MIVMKLLLKALEIVKLAVENIFNLIVEGGHVGLV
jgi:hypothetical protein